MNTGVSITAREVQIRPQRAWPSDATTLKENPVVDIKTKREAAFPF
jgi:hypothetical protein